MAAADGIRVRELVQCGDEGFDWFAEAAFRVELKACELAGCTITADDPGRGRTGSFTSDERESATHGLLVRRGDGRYELEPLATVLDSQLAIADPHEVAGLPADGAWHEVSVRYEQTRGNVMMEYVEEGGEKRRLDVVSLNFQVRFRKRALLLPIQHSYRYVNPEPRRRVAEALLFRTPDQERARPAALFVRVFGQEQDRIGALVLLDTPEFSAVADEMSRTH